MLCALKGVSPSVVYLYRRLGFMEIDVFTELCLGSL